MKFQGLIFDLWGTLVPSNAWRNHSGIVEAMALALGVELEPFYHWFNDETRIEREDGTFQTIEDNIRFVLDKMGTHVAAQRIRAAADLRHEFVRSILIPRVDALPTLEEFKRAGLMLGLISDCSPEVPSIWPTTELADFFEIALFSSIERQMKPSPDLYLRVSDKLGVSPERILYVGDGGSYELSGALEVGMEAVMIDPPDQRFGGEFRPEAKTWRGPVVEQLSELVPFVLGNLPDNDDFRGSPNG